MKAPIVITLEGGLVQSVRSLDGRAVNALVVDYDTDGADSGDLTMVGKQDDLAYVSLWRDSGKPEHSLRLAQVFRDLVKHDR